VLLGDRYGQTALLRTIPAVDFELFCEVAKDKLVKNGHLLHTWYEYDENAIPPTYVFKVRSWQLHAAIYLCLIISKFLYCV